MISSTLPLSRSCLAFVLAGGRGTRLHELTDDECKPAVPFAGSSRIIDFALANVLNSGLRHALVATQYRPARLVSHVRSRWRARFAVHGGSIETLSSGGDEQTGYRGAADAVYRNIAAIDARAPRHVLVLAADHIYQMDYERLLADHVASGADVTVAAEVVPVSLAHGFGILGTDGEGRIVEFAEKPAAPATLPDRPDRSLASMGIYVFDWPLLRAALTADAADPRSSRDFGRDVLPRLIADGNAFAHRFAAPGDGGRPGYWRDVGTIDALHEANMDLLRGPGQGGLDLDGWPLHVGWMGERREGGSLVFPDSEPAGLVAQSVVGPRVVLGEGARVLRSVLMPGAAVERGVRICNCVVAPDARLSGALAIGEDAEEDARWFRRTPGGVVLVDRRMLDRRRETRRILQGWRSGPAAAVAAGGRLPLG